MSWKNKFIEEGLVGKSRLEWESIAEIEQYLKEELLASWRYEDLPVRIMEMLRQYFSNLVTAISKYRQDVEQTMSYYRELEKRKARDAGIWDRKTTSV